jgi:uroporphyrinogen-III synthase
MSLAGRGVVVTRPRELAQGLAALIEGAGGRPYLFPAIEIRDLPVPQALQRIEAFDLAIFISPAAVEKAARHVSRWPRAAAVGAGTKRALESRGISPVIAPQASADSEALLALPEMQRMQARRVLIVRGEGGRALLGDTLRSRGAHVEYAECYRRARPDADPGPLLASWPQIHAVTVSSEEGLQNFFSMLGAQGEARLRGTPLFVPHARVAARAALLGVRETIVAGAGDGEMFERLVAYFAR